MPLFVSNQQDEVVVEESLERLLDEVGAQVISLLGLPPDTEISLALVDDLAIREMNRTYRGIDAPTDVLSFDLNELGPDEPWSEDPGERYLGEVVVSLEMARRQAREYGHSFEREVAYLAVHGLLHLAGYDHDRDRGGRLMRAKEEEVLALVGLSLERGKRSPRRNVTGKVGLTGEEARDFLAMQGIDATELLEAAWEARRRAYAPYSAFAVGAAVLGRSGQIYKGCNVENASYGLTLCAERAALAQAVLGGERGLAAAAVVAEGLGPCTPCGGCRQALAEFGSGLAVITQNERGEEYEVFTLEELLPTCFSLRPLSTDS